MDKILTDEKFDGKYLQTPSYYPRPPVLAVPLETIERENFDELTGHLSMLPINSQLYIYAYTQTLKLGKVETKVEF